jgi:hypothetical protein
MLEKVSQKLRSADLYNAAFHQGRKDDMTGFPEMEARRGAFPRALGVRGITPFCAHLEINGNNFIFNYTSKRGQNFLVIRRNIKSILIGKVTEDF